MEMELYQPKTANQRFVDINLVVTDFSSEELGKIERLEEYDEKAEYIRYILRMREEEKIEQQMDKTRKSANRTFAVIVLYLLAVFPLSYLVIANVSLNIFPALGAALLALGITAVVILLLIIKKIILEYHELKNRTVLMWDKKVLGDVSIKEIVLTVTVLGVILNVLL